MIGETSGCLEIIKNIEESKQELEEVLHDLAESDWNNQAAPFWWTFESYYDLNDDEINLLNTEKAMPATFFDKYLQKGYYLGNEVFLYHKKNPNTITDLRQAVDKRMLYKVRCNRCGREYFIDEVSFSCVKWKSCGIECLKLTVESQSDYTNNVYCPKPTAITLQTLDDQLSDAGMMLPNLTYYSEGNNIKVAYISDIHLEQHLKRFNNNSELMIRSICSSLLSSLPSERGVSNLDAIVFDGDTADSFELTIKFYSYFVRTLDLPRYIRMKSLDRARPSHSDIEKYEKQISRIEKYIKKRIEDLSLLCPSFDINKFFRYMKTYHSSESFLEGFDAFSNTPTYEKMNIKQNYFKTLQSRLVEIEKLMSTLNEYSISLQNKYDELSEIENKSDYKSLPLYHDSKNIYVTIGNHEYVPFDSVNECVIKYWEALSKLGIILLHNNYIIKNKFVIYGGTGFAKYSDVWNADNLCCCKNFTRKDEIYETELFEEKYHEALKYANEHGLCFLAVSHYPISSCLNNHFDKEAIYFTGHTHRNEMIVNGNKVLYADNQIGYDSNIFRFAIAKTGIKINPYSGLSDGAYQTSIDDYLSFYTYIGEYIGNGSLLYNICSDGHSKLYVVIQNGFYGFFLVRTNCNSEGISIVNGGKSKKITNSTDIGWICDNFSIVLSKYLKLLLPLRTVQNKLSKELRELGLKGTMHGCIVDINYDHHIMINPVVGTFEYYYSPSFGLKQDISSFTEVLKSLEIHNEYNISQYAFSKMRKLYDIRKKESGYLLSRESNYFLTTEEQTELESNVLYSVSRVTGAYGVSRKVSPLQRIFDNRVLRNFNIQLTETQQKPYRNKSYVGSYFNYDEEDYKIIEDIGSDIIVAEQIIYDSDNKTEIATGGDKTIRRFSLLELAGKAEWYLKKRKKI